MSWLQFVTLTLTGFVACAEFGSYAFVHPVIKSLPPREHLQVEQGLLKTFGRVMPVGMTAAPVLAVIYASVAPDSEVSWLSGAAVISLFLALAATIAVNVGINLRTGRWDVDNPPEGWKTTRHRWEVFQGVRSWLLLVGFVLLCAEAAHVVG
ncbi:MAG: anthrone oxygenase family protein [Nocardioidaceae bacterium]